MCTYIYIYTKQKRKVLLRKYIYIYIYIQYYFLFQTNRLAKINVYTYSLIINRYSRSILYFCIQSNQLTKCQLCPMIYENKYIYIYILLFFMINLMSLNYSFSASLNVLSWFNERQERMRVVVSFFFSRFLTFMSWEDMPHAVFNCTVQNNFFFLLDTHFYLFRHAPLSHQTHYSLIHLFRLGSFFNAQATSSRQASYLQMILFTSACTFLSLFLFFVFLLAFYYFEKPPTEYIRIDLIKCRY